MQTAFIMDKERRNTKIRSDERADWIGGELRKVYEETVKEPVPDRLLKLLKQLENNEGEGSTS